MHETSFTVPSSLQTQRPGARSMTATFGEVRFVMAWDDRTETDGRLSRDPCRECGLATGLPALSFSCNGPPVLGVDLIVPLLRCHCFASTSHGSESEAVTAKQ